MTDHHITLFFFSGTGNTWWVGERIAEALNTRGAPTELLSIEGLSHAEVEQKVAASDLIGIGYPIYASDAPLIMQQFIIFLPIPPPIMNLLPPCCIPPLPAPKHWLTAW